MYSILFSTDVCYPVRFHRWLCRLSRTSVLNILCVTIKTYQVQRVFKTFKCLSANIKPDKKSRNFQLQT